MKKLRSASWLIAAVLGLVFVGLGQQAKAADELKLTLGTGIAPTVPTAWFFTDFIQPRLKEYSNDRIKPNVQINGTLCSEHKCVEQVQLGQIDIGSVSNGNIGAFGSTFDITNLPYIFKDDEAAEKLLNGWLGEELRKRAAKEMGLHIIAIIPSYGFRDLDNCVREVRVPADLKGIKIRVTKTPVEFNLIKAWGGAPIPFDWAQLYEGLQTKVVEGMYIPDAYVAARKFYEVCRHITHTGGILVTHIVFMSKQRYDGLEPWAREIIDRISKEVQEASFQVDIEWRARRNEDLKGKVKIYDPTPEELQLWYAGAPAAWVAVKDKYDHALARRALKEQSQDALIKKLEEAGALN